MTRICDIVYTSNAAAWSQWVYRELGLGHNKEAAMSTHRVLALHAIKGADKGHHSLTVRTHASASFAYRHGLLFALVVEILDGVDKRIRIGVFTKATTHVRHCHE